MIQPDRPQMTVRRMRFACFITKATDTHSQYVILIAFPRQQWLSERASMLRLYPHRLSCLILLRVRIPTALLLLSTITSKSVPQYSSIQHRLCKPVACQMVVGEGGGRKLVRGEVLSTHQKAFCVRFKNVHSVWSSMNIRRPKQIGVSLREV
jgi:hypothetical protein